jgi:hypothetical protein
MPLPNVVIAGERRSGTTSLAKWLEVHPDVYLHPRLDMAYFVDDPLVGRRQWLDGEVDRDAWEQTHSVDHYCSLFVAGEGKTAIGEKSADYLFWQPAHERLARFLPEAKFIIILRDPVQRAWSHYWNEVGKGRETLSFVDALRAERARCRGSAYARDHLSYRTRGYYDVSLKRFYQCVARDRVHVVVLEECLANPVKSLADVFAFMGVDPQLGLQRAGQQFNENWTTIPRPWTCLPGLKTADRLWNQLAQRAARRISSDIYRARRIHQRLMWISRRNKTHMALPRQLRRDLADHFEPNIKHLERMIDRPLDIWRKAA